MTPVARSPSAMRIRTSGAWVVVSILLRRSVADPRFYPVGPAPSSMPAPVGPVHTGNGAVHGLVIFATA